MKKYKAVLLSVFAAAMLTVSGAVVYAEETEAAETAETVSEAAEEESEAEETEAAEAAAEEVGEDGLIASDRESLETYAQESIEMIVEMTDEDMQEVLNPTSVLSVYQDSVVESVESWMDAREELGSYLGILSHEITMDDDSIVIKSTCDFENGESVVTTTLNRDDLSMDNISFATAEKSLAQNLKEAALNTVMGLGTVFLVLIFLSFLIGQFKHISKLEAAFTKKAEAPAPKFVPKPAPPMPAEEEPEIPVVEETVDDGELIAVIAAAIAAAEGTTPDGFVVRTIRKSKRNNHWQRA